MKMVKHEGRDVGRTRKSANQSSSSVLNRLNRRKTNLWKTNQKRIAIIYSRADEGMDNRGKDMRGDGASDCSKAPQFEPGENSPLQSANQPFQPISVLSCYQAPRGREAYNMDTSSNTWLIADIFLTRFLTKQQFLW